MAGPPHKKKGDRIVTIEHSIAQPRHLALKVPPVSPRKLLTVGSLFSGIGGIDLGLERTGGFEIAWQVEIDPYCQKVLRKHWPDVARYGDIRTVGKHNLAAVDLLAGGFPCQDISIAGKRIGITGERSGLWKEFSRLICELRPRYILVENVAALLSWGIDTVLGDLAESGYDAEWQVLPAAAFGAPHIRERVFLLAYASSTRSPSIGRRISTWQDSTTCTSGTTVANTRSKGLQGSRQTRELPSSPPVSSTIFERGSCPPITWNNWWAVEPAVGRVAHGVSSRVDRLKGLGNAVVPQVAEYVGRCILAREEEVGA